MATDENKKLHNLRVVDLRAELEKRGLDKTGVKASLIERLQKALVAEGKNPDEYEFDLNDKKPGKRLSTSTRLEEPSDSSEPLPNESMMDISTLDSSTEAMENENQKLESNTGAESPLNLLIGEEEEESMLIISNDEHFQSSESILKEKDDEKTTNSTTATISSKETEENTATEAKVEEDDKEVDDEEEEEEEEEDTGKQIDDEQQEANKTAGTRGETGAEDKDDGTSKTKQNKQLNESITSVSETTSKSSNAPPSPSNVAPATPSEKESPKTFDKDKNKTAKSNPGRSLWVTNLLPSTRAQELKHLLSRYGKVIGAKVVQSSRYPRTRCYGYVTMETRAAADHCIEKLNNTELKGQIIRVAKVRPEHSLPVKSAKKESTDKSKKKTPPKQVKNGTSDKSSDKKKVSAPIYSADKKKEDKPRKDVKEIERNRSRSGSRKSKSIQKTERKSDILTFEKIREERERQRQRERERAAREEEKRRREIQRNREIEKRQREESFRLEGEREKLRLERERLDRQRSEIMRLERERQRAEREKLEQEKQELRRQQLRLEEARRSAKRPAAATSSSFRRDSATYTDDRKRLVTERHYDQTPPPPRFEVSSRESASEIPSKKELSKSRISYSERTSKEYSKHGDFKQRDYPSTERHSSSHHMVHGINNSSSSKYVSSSYGNREREREMREQNRRDTIVSSGVPPPRISKERYSDHGNERSPVAYRSVREERERRSISDHHSKNEIRTREHRYSDQTQTLKDGTRYREGNSWHANSSAPVKFGGIGGTSSSRDSWNKSDNWRPIESSSNDRWGSSSSRIIMSGSSSMPSSMYSGGGNLSGMGGGMSCPPPPGNSNYSMDRFDNYKSMNSSRKY